MKEANTKKKKLTQISENINQILHFIITPLSPYPTRSRAQ